MTNLLNPNINIHWLTQRGLNIPNGWLDAYELKVNIGIFKYQEKGKLISKFQIFFFHFSMAY